jgi:NAD(P)-dependent dehydrogenase (short-subunit alcohol dehydrogenase family)
MSARTIIVTGGFGILGQAVAVAFAAQGDRVARVDFATTPPKITAALDIGGADVTSPGVAEDVVAEVTTKLGPPTVLVNVAGGFVYEPLEAGDLATWQRMFQINTLTAAAMSKAALPTLKAAGAAAIINIGASAALQAAVGMGGYAASKSAVHRLTESLAAELKGTGVTVNAILPTIIDTSANRKDIPDANFGDWVKADAIADVIVFLASRAARAITGALIPVSRGTPS